MVWDQEKRLLVCSLTEALDPMQHPNKYRDYIYIVDDEVADFEKTFPTIANKSDFWIPTSNFETRYVAIKFVPRIIADDQN